MYFALRSLGLLTAAVVGSSATTRPLQADPPARIARVSYLTGSVSFRPAGLKQWVPASLSYPISTGAELWSDSNGRAEVHIGGSSAWLAPRTLVDLQDVADHATQLRVTRGELYMRVPRLARSDSYEIDTPDGAVSLLQDGAYRIDVSPDGRRSSITVRDGRAEVSAGDSTMELRSGQSLIITDRNAPLPGVTAALAVDDWERWADSRDLLDDQSLSLRYLSPDVVGFEALDNYGSWQIDADYGPVWVPEVPAGWAPYRFGSWSWIDPWGWTWIDDAPWGFAPSHYGRWAFLQDEWAWVPGEIVDQPVYAPALVGFLGGSGFDLSLSLGDGGAVAWFPLGAGRALYPAVPGERGLRARDQSFLGQSHRCRFLQTRPDKDFVPLPLASRRGHGGLQGDVRQRCAGIQGCTSGAQRCTRQGDSDRRSGRSQPTKHAAAQPGPLCAAAAH
jgi:hypothetical protein